MRLSEAYRPRPIRFLELWEPPNWRLKVYGIAYRGDRPTGALVDAAKARAREYLANEVSPHRTYGVGFLGVHEGRGESQIFLDRWANENELLHEVCIAPTDRPEAIVDAPPTHNSVCTWDLFVQAFEREAWIECVLANPAGPDLEAYLARRLNADV